MTPTFEAYSILNTLKAKLKLFDPNLGSNFMDHWLPSSSFAEKLLQRQPWGPKKSPKKARNGPNFIYIIYRILYSDE